MALRAVRRRRRASITSLIDVIFLLLLFFMLASTFTRSAEFELVSGAPGPGEADADLIHLAVAPDRLMLDGESVALSGLAAAVVRLGPEPGTVLAVEPAESAETERLLDVLMALREVRDVQIRVLEAP